VRYLNTMYVATHRTKVNRSKSNLVVSGQEGKVRVPLESIDSVVIVGGASMTLDAVGACVERGIRVAVLKRSGALRWSAGPAVQGNVALRRLQHRTSDHDEFRLTTCRHLVAGKLQNSHRILRRWARDQQGEVRKQVEVRANHVRSRIERIPTADSENLVRGIEGDAARAHFAGVGAVLAESGWRFVVRSRRPPRDPPNALLSFAYGLLVTETKGALESVGLDPQLGYLHRDRPGRPALALDLVEEFRPVADRFVVGALRQRRFSLEDFEVTPGGGTYLNDQGRSKFFKQWEAHKNSSLAHRVLDRDVERWALPGVQATLLARYIRGDIPVYPPFVVPG